MHRLGAHGEHDPVTAADFPSEPDGLPADPAPPRRVSDRDLAVLCLMSEMPAAGDRDLARYLGLTAARVATARARTRREGYWRPRYELADELSGAAPRIVAWGKAANGIAHKDFAALRSTLVAHKTSAKFRFRSGMFFAVMLPADFQRMHLLEADLLDLRTRGAGEFLFRSYDTLEFMPGPQVYRAIHKPTALIAKLLHEPASPLRPITIGEEPGPPQVGLSDLGERQAQVLERLILHPEDSLAETAAALDYSTPSVSHIKSRLVRDGILRHSFKADLARLGYTYILFVGRAHRPISPLQNWRYLAAIGGFGSAPLSWCFSPTASAAFFPFRSLESARAGAATYLAQCDELQMRCSPQAYIGSNAHTRSLSYCAPGDLVGASVTQAAGPAGELPVD